MMLAKSKRWVSAAAMVVATAAAAPAGADTTCGVASKTAWNVPDGGLVISRTGGVIRVILDAVNEWGTHTVLSNGYDSWVTHATATQPGQQDACSVPIKRTDLSNATPGAEQVTLPAIYWFYFGSRNIGSAVIPTRTSGGTSPGGVDGMEWYSGNSPDDDWGYYQDDADPWVFFPGGSNRGQQVADFEWNWPNYGMFGTAATDGIYRIQSDDGNYMRYSFY